MQETFNKLDVSDSETHKSANIVIPGEIISEGAGHMRGHGTFINENCLYSSLLGEVKIMNKLVQTHHYCTNYSGHVGDMIIGRVIEVGTKRWLVDTNSSKNSILFLSALNLPGGELRRRSLEDEIHMRDLLKEGDLIMAEVQMLHKDGSLALQTRNLQSGKLTQPGVFVAIPPYLIQKCKNHILTNLPSPHIPKHLTIYLGTNGYIWISSQTPENDKTNEESNIMDTTSLSNPSPFKEKVRKISPSKPSLIQTLKDNYGSNEDISLAIIRFRNIILSMAQSQYLITQDLLVKLFDASQDFSVNDLTKPETLEKIIGILK